MYKFQTLDFKTTFEYYRQYTDNLPLETYHFNMDLTLIKKTRGTCIIAILE